jgi:hypothetical protein
VRREASHRPAADVEQAGLPGQRLAVLDDADDVVAVLADATGGEDVDFARVAVHIGDLPAKPARDGAGVELGLDHDAARNDVQAAREAEQGRHLGPAAAWLGHVDPAQLVLDRCRHRHRLCHLMGRLT